MIIISKCPLRISLAGGSTDLQGYLDKYGRGKVISFTPNLFTYIVLKKSSTKYYKIVYSKIENVLTAAEIQNDIAREVLEYFNIPPVEVVFTADIPSTGSGLASSSSYLISMIKACLNYKQEVMSNYDIGKLAVELERRFNPLAGYQDVYGCLFDGLKSLEFETTGLSSVKKLPTSLFNEYTFYLVPTNITRSSTDILSTIKYEEVHSMVEVANQMDHCVSTAQYDRLLDMVKTGWEYKKATSSYIVTPKIQALESKLSNLPGVLAWRLIGAGSGGYFLVICKKDSILNLENIKIDLYEA